MPDVAVDLALAKAQCRVTHNAEDTLIQQYADTAAAVVEKRASVRLSRDEVTQTFAAFAPRLPLDWGPNPEDLVIAYVDSNGDEIEIDDATIVKGIVAAPAAGWPAIQPSSVITMTYTAGFATAPADLVSAQLLLIQIAYERRVATKDEEEALDCLIFPYVHIPV